MLKQLKSYLELPDADEQNGEVGEGSENSTVPNLSDAETRTEFSHELYIDTTNLADALADASPTCSLEIGCGYGRLTPWIAQHADEHHALDIARSLLTSARREYPDVQFQRARAETLPFEDDTFDLAVTWGVLNHVPGDSILAATTEINRVVSSDGTLVISEATAGTPDPRWEYRSISEWRDLFPSRELVWHTHTQRFEESFRDPKREHVVMKFR